MMKKLLKLKEIAIVVLFFLTTIYANAATNTYSCTNLSYGTAYNNFAMNFNTGVIPTNATVTLTITVTSNTSNDNRDLLVANGSQFYGCGNAYAIYGPLCPATVTLDISSRVRGLDLSTGDKIYSSNAWASGVRANFYYGSLTFSFIQLTVTAPISAPVANSATDITTSSFSANWSAVSGATKYYLDVATNSTFTSFVTGYNNLDVGNVTTYSVTGLSPGVTYYYRVRSYDGSSSSNSNTITVATSKLGQTITFNALSSVTYGSADIDPGATASSGLTVSYSSSNTSIATIVSGKIHPVAAGTVTIYADQAGNSTYNAAPQVSRELIISVKSISITGATALNKVYDGTTDATISGAALSGVVGEDEVSLSNATTGTFDDANIGTGITVTTGMSLTGADAANYSLSGQPSLTADITAKELTVTGAVASNKVYDGTTDATVSGASLSGIVGDDEVSLLNTTSGSFDYANVGTGITVTTSMSIDGADAGNYSLSGQPSLTADITAKSLTITGAIVENKEYDGTTDATVSGASLSGIVGDDDVSLQDATSGSFADASVGTGIAVTTGMSLTGADAGNYSLSGQPSLSADITAKALTVTGAVASDKIYDGNTDATVSGASLSGVVGEDEVSLLNATTGIFADANVGTGIAVSTAMSIDGADVSNYTLSGQPSLTADITAKELTIIGAFALDKVYDGTTDAEVNNATLSGVIGDDEVVLLNSLAGTFAYPNVGTGITVTTDIWLWGADADNYVLSGQPELTADITAKSLAVTGAMAENKEYDGTTDATISDASLNGVIEGDEVSLLNATTGSFVDANVGSDIAVTSNMLLNGADAGNYTLSGQPELSADITAKVLSITGAVAGNKEYDCTTDATVSNASLSGVVGEDEVSILNATTGSFADANVGTGKIVATYMSLGGANAGNYILMGQPELTADITAKALTITGAVASDKEYDGTTDARITGAALNGIMGEDEVYLVNDTLGQFASANADTDIPVVTNLTFSGNEAGNYTLEQAELTADITPKALTVTADDLSKTYGDENPMLTVSFEGFAEGESEGSLVTLPIATTEATQFSDVSVYEIVPDGAESPNYTFNYVNGSLTVNKAELVVTADDTTRIAGEENPVFTLSYSGFKGTDEASVIDVLPSASTSADISSPAGEYEIVLTGGSDNNYELVLQNGTLTITSANGIRENSTVSIQVYPNPVAEYLNIDNLPENSEIRIFTLNGEMVKYIISEETVKIDVTDLNPGMYLIKVTGKNVDAFSRFIKQ